MKYTVRYTFVFFIAVFCVSVTAQEASQMKLSDKQEIEADVSTVPCENKHRLEAVKKLFQEKGALASEIKIKDFKHVKNLLVEKKGNTEEVVIIGAHYDMIGGGCGAIDNWTGIVIIANLYKTIKNLNTNKTYKFVAFGKEEKGLIGSKAMAKAIPKADRPKYCAMVNLDSFGLAHPQALTQISNKRLIKFAKETAETMKMPFSAAPIRWASSDSKSFLDKKIPAITLHGLSARWRDYLHSSNDKLKNVNSESVYAGYRLGLNLLAGIEAESCHAFRKKRSRPMSIF